MRDAPLIADDLYIVGAPPPAGVLARAAPAAPSAHSTNREVRTANLMAVKPSGA